MPFGMAEGIGEEAFRAAVKRMTIKFIEGTEVVEEAEVPLDLFDTPICNYRRQPMATPPQNPTQKGPQQAPHLVEVKIVLNRITREITIYGPISDGIFLKGLFAEALRVYDQQRGKGIVQPGTPA